MLIKNMTNGNTLVENIETEERSGIIVKTAGREDNVHMGKVLVPSSSYRNNKGVLIHTDLEKGQKVLYEKFGNKMEISQNPTVLVILESRIHCILEEN